MRQNRVLMVYVEPTTYIVRLIRELATRTDWQVDVLFITENHSQNWNVPLDGIRHAFLPAGRLPAFLALRSRLLQGTCDVLHLAGWGHSHLVLAMLAGWLAGVPVLVETDTPLPHRLSPIKRVIKKLVYPNLFRIPARFLPGGTRQAEYLRHYSVQDSRIRIAYMTVDTTAISAHVDATQDRQLLALRARHGIAPEATVFLYVGRMEPHKGIRDLLTASDRLREARSAHALVLVGDGSLREEVTHAASRNGNIRYLGRLSGNDLLDAYALADVFVLPSSFEPWGLVVNEAMAAGLPVISSDRVGCIDDLVIAGETGCVVPTGSVPDLAAVMQRFVGDAEGTMAMGRRARKHIAPWTVARRADVMHQTWGELAR